jgi:hypothetical protein
LTYGPVDSKGNLYKEGALYKAHGVIFKMVRMHYPYADVGFGSSGRTAEVSVISGWECIAPNVDNNEEGLYLLEED